MKRDSIIFYRSFYEAICELEPDVQAAVYSAIFEYSLNFNEISLQGLPKTIFTLIKPQLDANNKRYENGLKGGRRKSNDAQSETKTEPKPNQSETKTEANVNVNVNGNVNEKEEKKEDIYVFNFQKSLIELGIEKTIVSDWLKVRRLKKSANTETAFKNIKKNIERSGLSANDCIKIAVEKSWSGFDSKWLTSEITGVSNEFKLKI